MSYLILDSFKDETGWSKKADIARVFLKCLDVENTKRLTYLPYYQSKTNKVHKIF